MKNQKNKKMKKIIILIIFIGTTFSLAQVVKKTFQYPKVKVTVQVIDETGNYIKNADTGIGFEVVKKGGWGTDSFGKRGLSNKEGFFSAEARATGYIKWGAKKEGYYRSNYGKSLFKAKKNGRWEPWNPTVEIVLKRKINPIPMYVAKVSKDLPEKNKQVGFDLFKRDWVKPYGKGEIKDLIIKSTGNSKDRFNWNWTYDLEFSNKNDGLILKEIVKKNSSHGSKLLMPHNAPKDGYKNKWQWTLKKEGKSSSFLRNQNWNANYFFRVRTKIDKKGNIISSHYGKIHGEFEFDLWDTKNGKIYFTYYLNPTPNDTNVEYDTKNNLFEALEGIRFAP